LSSIPFLLVLDWVVRIGLATLILLRTRREPSVGLAWLAVTLSLPIVGAVAYLLFGEIRLGRRRLARHREIVARVESPEVRVPHSPEARATALSGAEFQIAQLAESVGSNIPVAGNRLELFGNTAVVLERLCADIDAAKEHCHLLFYIWLDDESGRRVAEALARAAARGVACRVLVDAVGSRRFLASETKEMMVRAGVKVAAAMPAGLLRVLLVRLDLRNHRKIAVIDGQIGWTGSQNIANASFAPKARYAPWIDCMVRIVGPVVHDLQTLFVEDWYLDSDEAIDAVLRRIAPVQEHGCVAHFLGTGPGSSRAAARLLVQAMVQVAREEIILTTPYFVPDDATLTSLCTSARRGVQVKLIVPRRNDSRLVALASRGYYETMLEAGIEILEFNGGLLHAKTVTVDHRLALITSANLDRRSFELNFEAGLVVYDDDFASVLRFLQVGYMEQSTHVDRARWLKRPVRSRLAQNAAQLLSPLL